MWPIISILAVGGIIIAIEVPSLLKQKEKKELWIFSILLLVAIGLSIAQSLRVTLPNPLDWIAYVYKPLSELVFGWLEA